MVYVAVESFIGDSIAGAIPSAILSLAYLYNLVKAIQFVYLFDCKKYFLSHQANWAQKTFDVDIDGEEKYDPTEVPDETSSSEHFEDEIFANNKASLR